MDTCGNVCRFRIKAVCSLQEPDSPERTDIDLWNATQALHEASKAMAQDEEPNGDLMKAYENIVRTLEQRHAVGELEDLEGALKIYGQILGETLDNQARNAAATERNMLSMRWGAERAEERLRLYEEFKQAVAAQGRCPAAPTHWLARATGKDRACTAKISEDLKRRMASALKADARFLRNHARGMASTENLARYRRGDYDR